MKVWIIIAIVIVLGVGIFLFWKRTQAQKVVEAERSTYQGRTREELTEELKGAWKEKWMKSNTEWILTGQQPDTYKQAIIAEAEKKGDTTPIEDLAKKHSMYGWAKDAPKANDTGWGKAWLWTYVKNTIGMNPNGAEAQAIMSGI